MENNTLKSTKENKEVLDLRNQLEQVTPHQRVAQTVAAALTAAATVLEAKRNDQNR